MILLTWSSMSFSERHEMALHFYSCKQEVGTCKITCDITPNGVFCVFMTPPLPPQLLQGFKQLLDLAPVPSQLSHASKQEISISLCTPKTDSSKVKFRSYLQKQNKNLQVTVPKKVLCQFKGRLMDSAKFLKKIWNLLC